MLPEVITAARYIQRADELRAVADQIADSESRRRLISAAESYEQMAAQVISMAGRAKPRPDSTA